MALSFHTPGACLFCRIASGEVPSHIVHESEAVAAFLDIMPIRQGHVQVVPKAHHETLDDLPPELAAETIAVGQRIARALKRIHGLKRVAFLFTGGDIAHAHAHVVPMMHPTDITSRRYIAEERLTFRGLPRASSGELAAAASAIRSALEG